MKILLVEDNFFKREKVVDFLRTLGEIDVVEAASYNSGLTLALSENFDFLVLDMSMPTFDRTESDMGGRFKVLAGKEIVAKLRRQNRLVPFVILTGFADFSVETDKLNLGQINDLMALMGDAYRGTIFFDSANSTWNDYLSAAILGLSND
ncbi:response regulator [Pseudomonas sp. 91RF]|jgi:CheY-like chemotaxis protein|uniref:response regulator n=1 Tax=Pseudomonas TaxID=286 RepID=UPI000E665E6A|nr:MULTISPECIES: response regulator [Pseudomonas]RIJ12526.1 response regulator [Pseudomonas sp. 91RF]